MGSSVPVLLFYLIFGLVTLSSFVVWVKIINCLRAQQSPLPYQERFDATRNGVAVALVLAWISLHFIPVTTSSSLTLKTFQSECLLRVTLILILLATLTRLGHQPLSEFGLQLTNLRRQVADGVFGFLASLLPVFLVLFLTWSWRSAETQHPLLKLLDQDPAPSTFLWIFAGVVVLAPLAEEVFFRVVLQGWLQTQIAPACAICVVAGVFSVVHGFPDSLPLMPLAVVLGYVFYRRHSFVSIVVTHALFNALMLAFKFIEMWSQSDNL